MLPMYLVVVIAILVIAIVSKGLIVVRQAEVVIIERLGRYFKTLDSGIHIIVPIFDKVRPIHWRYNKTDYRGQVKWLKRSRIELICVKACITSPAKCDHADNVSININALLYFQITDPYQAVYEIGNLPEAIEKLTRPRCVT
jgi:regulator of protease activity HflC (stomatin/prohibitin superfamily)